MFKALDLPISWDAHKLGDIITHQKGYAFNSSDFQDSGTKVVRISDTTDSSINLDSCPCVSHELAKQFERFALKKGDVVISTVGSRPHLIDSAVGKTIRINAAAEGCLLNQNAVILRPHSTIVLDPQFLYLSLIYRSFRSHIEKLVRGNANQVSITLEDIFAYTVPLPPLAEQKKIVAILSSWDRAIELTEKLIEAKQTLKTGLMEQLLTGKRRFQGFGPPAKQGELPEDWKWVVLGDITQAIFSNVDKKTYSDETPVLLCNYLDVYNNRYISKHLDFMPATATGAEIHKFALKAEDVIITKDSETPEDIANAATVLEDLLGVVCGYHLAILRPHAGVSGFYLGQLLMLPQIRYQFSKVANGVTRFGLNFSSVVEIPLWLPSYDEQVKIAKVLMKIDHEIDALLLLSNQLKEQKRGLMQKLLTGQIRVEAASRV